MAQNIRRYKGVRPIPELRGLCPIRIDGRFEDWAAVDVEYRDTVGDTIHRDYPGYGGLHYKDDSGRNDIVTCKLLVSGEEITGTLDGDTVTVETTYVPPEAPDDVSTFRFTGTIEIDDATGAITGSGTWEETTAVSGITCTGTWSSG